MAELTACDMPRGIETVRCLRGDGALWHIPELAAELFPARRPLIVADENTWRAAGEKLQRIMADNAMSPYPAKIYPAVPRLHADAALVAPLAAEMPDDAVALAVGGGTINDIVKRASFVLGRRYICVVTGCSVDGFTASGSAMLVDGLKQTLPCTAPLAVVADTAVLTAAPPEMAAGGFADLLAKVTAGADWLMTDTLGIEKLAAPVWSVVQDGLPRYLADPQDMAALFDGLAATGFAMQLYGDSRPASGAEHLVSHVWEMENVDFSHGFKVGVGTVAILELMERFYHMSAADLREMAAAPCQVAARRAEVDELLAGGHYGGATGEIAMGKFRNGKDLTDFRRLLWAKFPELSARVLEYLGRFFAPGGAADGARRMLRAAHCPTGCAELGLTKHDLVLTLRRAQLIRRRYTILDLLFEAGVFPAMLAKMEE